MKILIAYLKKETVLCIAVLLAAFSMLLIHPDSKYSGYMDYRTLALLFSLMTIMEGFKQTGFFADVARALLGRVHTFRQLYLVLVMLCFFCSMWITHDVALLTFVPFTMPEPQKSITLQAGKHSLELDFIHQLINQR